MAAEKLWTESIWKSVRGTLFAFTGKARDCEDIKSRICFRTLRWWKNDREIDKNQFIDCRLNSDFLLIPTVVLSYRGFRKGPM